MNLKKIGKFIAECRKDKKLTQEQLAEKLGVTNKSVSRWENGITMPDYSILKELCNILEIDVNEFLLGEKIKKEDEEIYRIKNLDNIFYEYDRMKKKLKETKQSLICTMSIITIVAIQLILMNIVNIKIPEMLRYVIITDINRYEDVIGMNAEYKYKNKWGISEEIFPKYVNGLDVKDFKMVYYDPWDAQYLCYLVIAYSEDEYSKEVERLNNYGIEDYIGYYEVTGFTNYTLLAMESDAYHGFVYAVTDGKSRIIYVETIFCNYFFDIKYEEQIPREYLPDNFNAHVENKYREKMMSN